MKNADSCPEFFFQIIRHIVISPDFFRLLSHIHRDIYFFTVLFSFSIAFFLSLPQL